MSMQIDGTTVERIRVDGAVVHRLNVDGTQAWPWAYTKMTAASQSFSGNTQYGYSDSTSTTFGSISEDTTLRGDAISEIKWIDFDSGTDVVQVSIGDNVPQDRFTALVLETDQGLQKFYTAQADDYTAGSSSTSWQWNLGTRPFTASTVYEVWFV